MSLRLYRYVSWAKAMARYYSVVLLGAWKCSYILVAVMMRDEPSERAPGQAIHQLREYRLSGVHRRASPEKGPGNRRQLQIDTTQKCLKAISFQMPTEGSFAVNRTVVNTTIA